MFAKADNTAPNNNNSPKGDASNLKLSSNTINKMPANETIKPKILVMDNFSLKANRPRKGENNGIVAITTDAIVGETCNNPKLSAKK